MDSGIYIAIFSLDESRDIRVGSLGVLSFPAGYWLYVGSAQRNLQARLDRHGLADKKLRWHIDYLSSQALMLGAIMIPGDKHRECQIAAELGRLHQRPIRNFGASDCRCGGHLFYADELI
jgi:sugar fermentation stimulation protein A